MRPVFSFIIRWVLATRLPSLSKCSRILLVQFLYVTEGTPDNLLVLKEPLLILFQMFESLNMVVKVSVSV